MAKFVYCSECGTKSQVIRKAIKAYGTIINIVTPHVCPDEPLELDLTPQEVPTVEGHINQQFVQKLNELEPTTLGAVSTADLRDRRPSDQVKSSAPASLKDLVKTMDNTVPEGDISSEPEGD